MGFDCLAADDQRASRCFSGAPRGDAQPVIASMRMRGVSRCNSESNPRNSLGMAACEGEWSQAGACCKTQYADQKLANPKVHDIEQVSQFVHAASFQQKSGLCVWRSEGIRGGGVSKLRCTGMYRHAVTRHVIS